MILIKETLSTEADCFTSQKKGILKTSVSLKCGEKSETNPRANQKFEAHFLRFYEQLNISLQSYLSPQKSLNCFTPAVVQQIENYPCFGRFHFLPTKFLVTAWSDNHFNCKWDIPML